MKLVLFLFLGSIIFSSCNKQEEAGSIVEENNLCICTKEYIPVCGEDGKTYGNACEANCEKIKFTEGECSK